MASITFLLLSLSFAIGLDARPQTSALSRHSESRFRSSVRSASIVPRHDNSTDHEHPDSTSCAPYWLENIKHQGVASFNKDVSYQVFRNVKDFGAVGDGKTDDTAAIQKAISEGGRCKPGECHSSTTTPAIVYFPQGTYLISASIIDYYYTQIIGNPNCLPTIIASKDFNTTTSLGLIDGSPYQATGKTGFGPTNTFFRQVRNLILDTTQIPASSLARGIHWPTAQTTTLQNLIFKLSAENGTQHEGVFIEEGSGGFMADLTFHGGNYGFNVGNQQFTTRNLTFKNCVTAINQLWDWGWTYKSVSIQDCQVGFNISAGGPSAVNVGSVTIIDSEIINTPIGVVTSRTTDSKPDGAGSFYAENIKVQNVATLYSSTDGKTTVPGPNGAEPSVVAAFAHGRRYMSNGEEVKQSTEVGDITPTKRPKTLVDANGKFYERSKPQYETLTLDKFLSVRSEGAKGDGVTDDTEALNAAILKAKNENKILFVDAGFYLVTKTVYIPPGAKIVGEALASVILSSGDFFNSMTNPQPVVKVAEPGERGTIEWSDMFVSTQGQQVGAILIEYNLGSYDEPAGMWDIHTRIGGFAGSKLQSEQCPTTPKEDNANSIVKECIAAYMSMHVTKFGTGLYMENNWLWTADHDLDDPKNNDTQITIYTGRGLLIESIRGTLWLYGTAVEHHSKYQYQFVDTRDIVMGQIQTETAYYQPNPDATKPFDTDVARYDPVFEPSSNSSTNSANGWGLRILRSSNLLAYGVGLYSFFDNYSTACSQEGANASCQTRILSIEGSTHSHDVSIYNLNTVGTAGMITRDGKDLASYKDNNSTFVDTINVFRTERLGTDTQSPGSPTPGEPETCD